MNELNPYESPPGRYWWIKLRIGIRAGGPGTRLVAALLDAERIRGSFAGTPAACGPFPWPLRGEQLAGELGAHDSRHRAAPLARLVTSPSIWCCTATGRPSASASWASASSARMAPRQPGPDRRSADHRRADPIPALLPGAPSTGLTCVCSIFREDHRCLHDFIADTIVVRAELGAGIRSAASRPPRAWSSNFGPRSGGAGLALLWTSWCSGPAFRGHDPPGHPRPRGDGDSG